MSKFGWRRDLVVGALLVGLGVLSAGAVLWSGRSGVSASRGTLSIPGALSAVNRSELSRFNISLLSSTAAPLVHEEQALQEAAGGLDAGPGTTVRAAQLGKLVGSGHPLAGCLCWVVAFYPPGGVAPSDNGILHVTNAYAFIDAMTGKELAVWETGQNVPAPRGTIATGKPGSNAGSILTEHP